MEILVTGGSGFIGKAFIKSYRKVFDIVAPSHEEMDLTDARSVDAFFKGHKAIINQPEPGTNGFCLGSLLHFCFLFSPQFPVRSL